MKKSIFIDNYSRFPLFSKPPQYQLLFYCDYQRQLSLKHVKTEIYNKQINKQINITNKLKDNSSKITMGGCQSTDNTQIPSGLPLKLQNKFNKLEKHTFTIPSNLNQFLEPISQDAGNITNYIGKMPACDIQRTYFQINIQENLDSDKQYVDKSFPASEQAIGPQKIPETIIWKRPHQIFDGNSFALFQGQIEPFDIKQGKLNDCYFLSALASMSLTPIVVKRILQTAQTSTYGMYGAWFCIDGIWQCVVIDDRFPTSNGKPIFSRNHQNQIWVMLIEKAYAKVYGSYQAIQFGITGLALSALTGAPYEYLCKDSSEKINSDTAWIFINDNLNKNHLVCGSTENNDRNKYLGLVSEHVYTILDAKEVFIKTKKGQKKERIMKLLNPWGQYQWKGRWSEYSDVWSEELREQLNFQKADDGMFWIGIEDFVENFGNVCSCKYNKNYVSSSLPLKFSMDEENSYKGVFLSSKMHTEGYLTLVQTDHRKFHKTAYEYSPARVIILKIQKSTKQMCQYINDIFDCDHDATMEVTLEPGDYYVFIEMDWKCNFTRTTALNFYGQHFVCMVQDPALISPKNLFNQIVLLHQKFTQKQRVFQYNKDEKILRITGSIAGYVYYHYSNKSTQNSYLCESVELTQKKFISVYGQQKNDQFVVKVYPQQERIVTLKVNKQGNGFYTFSTKIQYYIVEKYSLEKLRQLADKKPTKMKKRQIEGKQIDVRIKTYNYSGGIVLLYQNKMDKYAYVEEITFELDNLQLQNQTLSRNSKLQIELQPQAEKLLSFVVVSPGKEVSFRTKMSFYLNSPEFKF